MEQSDTFYIKLAEIVHQAVVNWDPIGLIEAGAPEDEYDTIEKRFLSGLINSHPDELVVKKVKSNLQDYGFDIGELSESKQLHLDLDIIRIINDIKELSANN